MSLLCLLVLAFPIPGISDMRGGRRKALGVRVPPSLTGFDSESLINGRVDCVCIDVLRSRPSNILLTVESSDAVDLIVSHGLGESSAFVVVVRGGGRRFVSL